MNDLPFDFDERIDRREVPALKTHQIVLGADGMDLFPAGVADMDFRVAPPILEAMRKRLEHGIFGYETLPSGLMEALTSWLEMRHDWRVGQDQILRSPNILNSLAMTASAFSNPGDGIIVQPPVFFDFYDIIRENNRELVANPLLLKDGRYAMDFAGLEKLAALPTTRMLFLCNPHNPVGRVWTKDELCRINDICIKNNVLVVSDEIHADIIFPGHNFTPFASISDTAALNSVTCLSPAKSFNIAACCSSFMVVADEGLRTRLKAENSRLTVNKNNAFASVAMEAAYLEGGPWLDAVIEYLCGNLKLVRDRLSEIPGVALIEPEGTFLLWVDFRGLGLAPDELNPFLREQAKWATTRGQAFGAEGNGFARLNIACRRHALDEALQKLAHAITARG